MEFRQSLNGLQTFALFTAPAAGKYFITGQLTLPGPDVNGTASQVVAVVNQNGSPILTTSAGSKSFVINSFTVAATDAITVVLSSSSAPDQIINAVSGQVVMAESV